MYFFTADTHFGHDAIIEHCNRPFANSEDQTSQLIERWNAVVRPGDHVFVLGDFAFKAPPGSLHGIFESLHGSKSLVLGNHDNQEVRSLPWTSHDARQPELALTNQLRFKHNKQTYFMCHYAWRTWPEDHHGSIHLFGHSHGSLPDHDRSTDVGVDCWNYYPVSVNQIRSKFA
ncbi:metallophosphoesterase family protein [Flexibacterium corallicola]|uniref:metallophosphoesterase family protein n=1 Tax=Flexibacterium corallicola TaxID=3037259 RepID=UPI00286FAA2A|nr:metallophosphoesterase family protein [Pseudovibrio sp. M1P-2-3]